MGGNGSPDNASRAMDTRLSNAVTSTPIAPARVEPVAARQAVRTDLPPPAAVSAQAGAEQARFGRSQHDANEKRRLQSSIETDRETGDLVYKVIDPESRTAVAQYPYESVLRLRAYIRTRDEENRPL